MYQFPQQVIHGDVYLLDHPRVVRIRHQYVVRGRAAGDPAPARPVSAIVSRPSSLAVASPASTLPQCPVAQMPSAMSPGAVR